MVAHSEGALGEVTRISPVKSFVQVGHAIPTLSLGNSSTPLVLRDAHRAALWPRLAPMGEGVRPAYTKGMDRSPAAAA
jgi:hypothetical protein